MAITKNIIPVSVEDRFIAVSDHTQITAGNVGVDFLAVTLDAEWSGLNTYVTFSGCAQDSTTLDYAAELEVPWEQIEEAGDLYIGVQGFDPSADVSIDTEGQLVTNGVVPVLNAMAMTVPIKVRDSGAASGVAPTEPTPGTLQRVEQDLLAFEKLTEGAGETIDKADTAAANANSAAAAATAAAGKADTAAAAANAAAEEVTNIKIPAWQNSVDSLLATGGTYEARISALEAIENTREMTYEQIRAVTTEGVASRYLPVGDQLIVPWKYGSYDVQDWAWDVVHHFDGSDADHPLVVTEDGKKRPAVMLMAHTACPQECQWDAKEAFYAADEAMAAGTYTFEVSITSAWGSTGEWAVTGTRSFQFTLSGEAPAGSLLMFSGDPYAAKLDTMSVQVFDGFTAVSASQTCAISSGSNGTSLGTMSTTPNGNINAYARATYGSNDPKASKTLKWLNSADEAIVEVAATKWDRQSIMNGKAGFMTGFDPAFLAILGKVKAMVQPHAIDGSELEELYCTFRPISAKEHYFSNYLSATTDGYNAEGTGVVLDYWKNIAAANGRTSPWAGWNTYPELITYDAVSKTTARHVWLLSVYRNVVASSNVGHVATSGSVGTTYAYGSLRVPPACLIVGDPVEH